MAWGYFEHVIRDEKELLAIMEYMKTIRHDGNYAIYKRIISDS